MKVLDVYRVTYKGAVPSQGARTLVNPRTIKAIEPETASTVLIDWDNGEVEAFWGSIDTWKEMLTDEN